MKGKKTEELGLKLHPNKNQAPGAMEAFTGASAKPFCSGRGFKLLRNMVKF